ncbi:MAG: hypothetical protein COA74_03360 [Gammaproteobacteria bacterium]|nr:MAG: hypothetical protein COA74_03360 [Gammaproteobacteria bacterium]
MPSSTSNSDTFNAEHESVEIDTHDEIYIPPEKIPYRVIPEQPWSKAIAIAGIFLVIALVVWEGFAYKMHHTPGNYQTGETYMWAAERSKLDVSNDIKVVLTGSSRVLWGFDMAIVKEHLGTQPLQLALPGTGPALFVEDIIDNTDFNGLMIVGVAPFLFNRMDEGYFGQGAIDAYNNVSPSKYTGAKIHDFLSDYLAFLDESFSLPELMERYSNLPYRSGSKKLMNEQWKLGNSYKERLTEMWEPVELVGSFDNIQITNFWSGGLGRPIPEAEEMNKMAQTSIDHYKPLLEKLRARGGDMLFIRMPTSGDYLRFSLEADYYNHMWVPMIRGLDVAAIHAMDHPELSTELEIPEWSHLSRKSQDDFSHKITAFIDSALKDKSGKSVYELLE